jgi:uncharacterized membrane protein YdbT with pleckstrin-like domain
MPSDPNNKSVKPRTATLTVMIAIVGALVYGFVRSSFINLSDFVHANHEYAADATLLFFIAIYIVSKAIIIRKRKKENGMTKKLN